MTLTTAQKWTGILAIAVPFLFGSVVWISTRASADELKQVAQSVERTATAVEGLTFVIFTDQLKAAHDELAGLRVRKQKQAVTWSADDEVELLNVEQRVKNLQSQIDEMIRAKAADAAALAEGSE